MTTFDDGGARVLVAPTSFILEQDSRGGDQDMVVGGGSVARSHQPPEVVAGRGAAIGRGVLERSFEQRSSRILDGWKI